MNHPPLDALKSAILDPAPRLRDVVADAPRLAHSIADLETDRREILAAFDTLTAAPAPPAADDLVRRLTAYRQRAADLLYQAYGVDLGGET